MKLIVNTKSQKQILDNLSKAVDFVNKCKKGKAKAKSFKQFLKEL